LLGGFTFVVMDFEIWIILDLSYNYVTVAKLGQRRPKGKDGGGSVTSATK